MAYSTIYINNKFADGTVSKITFPPVADTSVPADIKSRIAALNTSTTAQNAFIAALTSTSGAAWESISGAGLEWHRTQRYY